MAPLYAGNKDPERIKAALHGDLAIDGYRPYLKKTRTFAKKMDSAFLVETLEGLMTGKPGDYLAIGAQGEMYPIDAAVFEETYNEVCGNGTHSMPHRGCVLR